MQPSLEVGELASLRARVAELEALVRDHDLAPIPPTAMRVRVGGWDDPDHFLGVGRKVFWDIKRLLGMEGRTLDSFRSILDFGCGCGRTFRFIPPGPYRLTGCDIDPETAGWCRDNLGRRGEFHVTQAMPPLPFADAAFDFVYAISVFTHLPEGMQFAWLDELARVVAPGGYLLATAHGASLLQGAAELHERLAGEGFLYVTGGGTAGLPDFYQTSFHLPEYVKAKWTRGFRVAQSLPRGVNNHQDAYLLRRE